MRVFYDLNAKRLFAYWFLLFVVLYPLSLLLFTFAVAATQPLLILGVQLLSPISFFFFGWLYFRGVPANTWPVRFVSIAAWVFLTMFGSAILAGPMYGVDWTLMMNARVLGSQAVNAGFMLLAALLVGKKRTVEAPEGLLLD